MIVKVIRTATSLPTYVNAEKIVAISEPVYVNDNRFDYYIYFDHAIACGWKVVEDKENTADFDKYEDILNIWKKLNAD